MTFKKVHLEYYVLYQLFQKLTFFLHCRTYFRYSLLLPFCFKINLKFLWSGNLLQSHGFLRFVMIFWTKAVSSRMLQGVQLIQYFQPLCLVRLKIKKSGGATAKIQDFKWPQQKGSRKYLHTWVDYQSVTRMKNRVKLPVACRA